MPVTSEAQRRLMEACAHGGKCPPGLSPEEAKRFLADTPKGTKLPKKAPKK